MRWVMAIAFLFLPVALFAQQAAPLDVLNKQMVTLSDKKGVEGHGTIVGSNRIITAWHVAEHMPLTWRTMDGRGGDIAKTGLIDKERDLAVLFTGDVNTFASWAAVSPRQPLPGETLWFRLVLDSDDSDWNFGHYVGKNRKGEYVLDAMAWPGSSGSGIVDANGNVIAVLRGAIRPGVCLAAMAQLNMQYVVDCILTASLARSGIQGVPVGAIAR